jgi:hypothetical protein
MKCPTAPDYEIRGKKIVTKDFKWRGTAKIPPPTAPVRQAPSHLEEDVLTPVGRVIGA